ncbi:MAG: DNA polymerase III subunit beta [Deltaproteobacteria bacterium]|nr:DNA polymerase III subunit beta [Deltaproteobacteria bacterium]
MKFEIKKDVFLKVLQRVQGVVEKRNTMPILANMLIKALHGKIDFMATDLEVSIKDQCDAVVTKEGSITINARKLFEIIKEAPEDKIDIAAEGSGKIVIKSGKAKFNIVGLPAEEFPSFPAYEEGQLFRVAPEVLKEMIEKTAFAASTDETRYNINGVFVEKEGSYIRMVATDGHRLAVIERSSEWPKLDKGVILPRKGIFELKKIINDAEGSLSLAFTANSMVIKKDGTVVVIRLIDGEFPDYKQVIPKGNEKKIELEREGFLSSLKRVSLLSMEKGRGVKFCLSKGKMELSSSNPDVGEAREEINVDYKNDGLEVGFNATYIMDALGVLDDDKVVLELKDRESPAILKAANKNEGGYLYVIMPMRI